MSTALTDSLLPGTSSAATGTGTSKQRLEKDADENLANHFQAVQAISDSTTLPQMLEELERHLNRAASLAALILRLGGVFCARLSLPSGHPNAPLLLRSRVPGNVPVVRL